MKEITKLPSMLSQSRPTHVKTKREPRYSASDIASLLGLINSIVNYRIKKLGLVPESKTNSLSSTKLKGKLLYKGDAIALIKNYKGDNHPHPPAT